MNKNYLNRYKELYLNHWWWRSREVALVFLLEAHFGKIKNKNLKILDIGCGEGLFFNKLEKFGNVQGIEPFASTDNEKIYNGDLFKFNTNEEFDLVLMLDVVEHVKYDKEFFEKALSFLKKGGVVLVTVPAFMDIWTHHDDLNDHKIRYTKKTFLERLKPELQVLEFTYFFHALAGLKWILKFIQTKSSDIKKEQAVSLPGMPWGPVNYIAKIYHLLEFRLFRKLPIPFGSSLIYMAKK